MTLKNKYKYLSLIFLLLLFTSCSMKEKEYVIKDLKTYTQDGTLYTQDEPFFDKDLQKKLNKEFNEIYFSPWSRDKLEASKRASMWGFIYSKKRVYGDNYKRITKKWFTNNINNSNFKDFNTLAKKAIVLKNSNLRVFPSDSKIFYNPKKVAEGFPFDYNQNSGIKINTPIIISHYSKDKAWVFVESSFTIGWLKVEEIAFISKKQINILKNLPLYIAVKDNFPIYKDGNFLEYIKLSTIFSKYNKSYYLTKKDKNNMAILVSIQIDDKYLEKKPLDFTKKNISKVINELIEEPYGWGEILRHRDCSALTRDYASVFGIYLNRNSKAQKKNGRNYNLKAFNDKDKKEFIIKNAKPFLSLLYLRGHIMVYIGHKDGEPLVFHNMWGIARYNILAQIEKTIIGKAVITSLEPGKEILGYAKNKSILKRVTTLINLDQRAK